MGRGPERAFVSMAEGLHKGGVILRFQVLLQGRARKVWEGSRKTTFKAIPFTPKEQ